MREVIELGNQVFCDDCNGDFTHSDACGGLQFQSRAICPECMPTWEHNIKRHGEEQFIRARCPEGMPFRKWVIEILRGGKPGQIVIESIGKRSPNE